MTHFRKGGRSRLINEREKRKIIRKIKENPLLSASTLTAELREESGKNVSAQTVWRLLKGNGYNSRVAIKKPYISEVNRKKRFIFAKDMIPIGDSWRSDAIDLC